MTGPRFELCFIISPAAPRILRLATRAGKTGGLACFDPAKENHYVKQTNKVNNFLTILTIESQKAEKQRKHKFLLCVFVLHIQLAFFPGSQNK